MEENGEDVRIDAKVVMVASGGYANNTEWIKKYAGLNLNVNLIPIGNDGKMGDGIYMAYQIGAASEGIGVIEMLPSGKKKTRLGFANRLCRGPA